MDLIKKYRFAGTLLTIGMFLMVLPDPAWSQVHEIGIQSLHYQVSVPVIVFSRKTVPINCPVHRATIIDLVADGQEVVAGDVIVRFDQTEIENRLVQLRDKFAVMEAEEDHKMTQARIKLQKIQEKIDRLWDDQAVCQAKLNYLHSLPLTNKVKIAQGQMRIAGMELAAATQELDKARNRYEKRYISKRTLEKTQREFQLARANYDYQARHLERIQASIPHIDIRLAELELANIRLDIEKTENELLETQILLKIQRDKSESKKQETSRQISDLESDLTKTTVTAQQAGVVRLVEIWGQKPEVGRKLWKGLQIAEILDLSELGIKGTLRESDRKYIHQGDPVWITLRSRPSHLITGQVESVSTLSHDLAEKGIKHGGDSQSETGIKVFDLMISVNAPDVDGWIKPGMRGTAEIIGQQLQGPAVPIHFVTVSDNASYLSLDGVYRKVTGVMNQGWFVLDDVSWTGKVLDMEGRFVSDENRFPGVDSGGRLKITGEVSPITSTDILVGDWYGFAKIIWLIPEETQVKQGDIVAKLDVSDVNRKIEQLRQLVKQHQKDLEQARKQLDITRREGQFKLKKARNDFEISALKLKKTLNKYKTDEIDKKRLDLMRSRFELETLSQELNRHQLAKIRTKSPAAIEELRRDLRRHQLKLEKQEIELQQLLDGPDPVTISQAQLDHFQKQTELEILEKQIDVDSYEKRRAIQKIESVLKLKQQRLRRMIRYKNNATIQAPRDGIVLYATNWSSRGKTKTAIGQQVWSNSVILTIPNMDQMKVRLEIPEFYYEKVRPGMTVDVYIPAIPHKVIKGDVTSIELMFGEKTKKDKRMGLYSDHEPLGESVFYAHVRLRPTDQVLKPGIIAHVIFPFQQQAP